MTDPHEHELASVEEVQQTDESLSLHIILQSIIPTGKYILFAVGEPCEHGCPHAEAYSSGLTNEEIKTFLVDAAASFVAADPPQSS